MCRLIIVTGATASGKTDYAISLAKRYNTVILSCDSRQFYKELNIGVARPTEEQLRQVKHYFIACRSVTKPYNIYEYEKDALATLDQLFKVKEVVVAVGGSGMYIEALRHGVFEVPDPTHELRQRLQAMTIEQKRAQLRLLDPATYEVIDVQNPARMQRALEVCYMTGKPYSLFVQEHKPAVRQFDIEMVVVERERGELRERINKRVDIMIDEGLEEEARSVMKYRLLNTMNTVGYKEMFDYFDGKCSIKEAVENIKLNTWHYARKQMSWIRRMQRLDKEEREH